ncbi:claudin domain-containing protein 2-like isoform X2 [Actinia tenebrosa]|uniref:Claudin domain-containing protein 2-like isoform X2 n=1 Tax=Actinia tenebrosa TaxID=6105 RepID=A0A6P8HAE5_ACTTE|nr:claudin domain-containing protein 2-like isoform X2 [Actinia tenebrosa]
MIKILTTFQCALVAILMAVLGLATDYWKVWWMVEKATNIKRMYNAGLFYECSEATNNNSVLIINHDCTSLKREDWAGAVVAFIILAMICHLIAFIFALVNACRKGEPFPVFWVCGLFLFAALFVVIGLLVYTFINWESDIYFSWSYGGGWSTVALSVIALVLILADR